MTDYEKDLLRQKVAQRIFDYIDPWDRDYESSGDIANDIKNNPELVCEYLMDLIDQLNG